MSLGSQILIFFAVGWHIRQNNSLAVSLQFCSNKTNVPADLQSAGIEYKDFSIRLLPISYCIGMSLGSKILIFFAVG